MAFQIIACEQRSPEWFACRAGRVTSSCAAEMLSTLKSGKGETAGRRNLRVRLALERVVGKPLERETFQSQAMLDGIAREADALSAYEAMTGELVERSGFLVHDELQAGTSLDGHIGQFDGVVEAKCPIPATHLDYLRTGAVPHGYLCQITHHLYVTGAAWADFLSFQPDLPDPLRVKLVRVRREDVDLAAYELLLRQFLREVDAEVSEIAALAAKGVA
jgi:hypothetical protein